MKDYEFKKEDLISIINKKTNEAKKVFRVTTRGKFAENVAEDPKYHFIKDISWIKKANPIAAQVEKKYYERDHELLFKRREQKLI